MFVIGTAGHVDHGKSALVRALTGIDPDRLQEEKDRGMTIDLGFAWLKLPGGMEVSIVDVPGHERFIKNMLAGVGGIDLALLVVAADEGVMPQTREHLAILDLLGVNRGILVLTKSDLVEPDWLDMVGAELEDVVSSTTLAGSPLVKCSTKTGDGLAELISVIEARLAETPPKRDLGRPRLHVDRVFTVSGFGTVVTGTLIDGTLNLGQEVEVVPAIEGGHLTTLPARVRGLQSHKSKVEQSEPGSRTAANLAGVDRDQLHRGQVVTTAGWLKPSLAVDVQLRSLETLTHTLRHNLPVTFHTFSSEAPGVLRLLDADELLPGDTAWAQVRLKQPLAVLTGDRFIIRDANETIGGGTIIATQAKRHPRRRESVLTELARLEKGDPADTVYSLIAEKEPVDLEATIRQTDLTREVALAAAESLIESGRIVRLGPADSRLLYTSAGLEKLRRAASTATTAYLAEHPLRPGIPKEELRSRLKLSARNFNLLLEALPSEGGLKDAGVVIAPEDWAPQLTPVQQQTIDAYLALLKENPKAPDTEHRPDDELVAYLVEQGSVVDAGNGVVFDAGAYREMVDAIVGLFATQESVTLAQVRDLLGTSRRYVQALLEHMDSERITIRRGDERVLRRSV